jgi:peptidoglycan/xylan/chitin deacetylase (PgdA/CDA1 family)
MSKLIMALVIALGAAGLTLGVSGASAGPINNDCSAGTVAFTFDDGPDVNTPAMMQQLQSLNMTGTFFVNGDKVDANPTIFQQEIAAGYTIGNHTYDHVSFTGQSTGTPMLTDAQITSELQSADQSIIAAGGSQTTLYRPPYGDINAHDDLLARNLGYRIVMPWGQNIVDSGDWRGNTTAQIVNAVTNGYTDQFGNFKHGIQADSIVAMHDGLGQATLNSIAALPAIADWMNTHHLCSTGTIRPDATGGYVPAPAPPEPTSGNLVSNPSLEQVRTSGNTTEPVCFQQAGASVNSNTASWSLTSDAHSGTKAERVDVSSWAGGDRKLVMTQRQSEATCLAAVTPGKSYSTWVWYKGSFPDTGPGATKVSIAVYYKVNGNFVYWTGGSLQPSTSAWNLAYLSTPALPANATAISFGLAIQGPGSLTTDDYAMVQN